MDGIDKLIGAITTTGSANAYVLTSGQTLTAYATGQRFRCKLNFTCSGSSTLNVDSIGAKTIKKRDATTNVSSSDLVSGQVYTFTYDGTNMVLETYVASDVQPRDATLTALAALSWSSLTPVLQFTAADTVSLTSAPKVTTLELGDATDATLSRSGAGVLAVEGDPLMSRAVAQTMTANFTIAKNTPVHTLTDNASSTSIASYVLSSTAYRQFGATNRETIDATTHNFLNGSGAVVGSFLASGLQAPLAVSSETSGTLTAASANKKVKMSGNCTIDASVFAADTFILLENNSASTRTVIQGTVTLRLSGSATTGTRTMAIRSAALLIFDTASDATLHGGNVT